MSHLDRDPWVDVKTFHGFAADHVISALQKEIRRGHTLKTPPCWPMK